MVYKPKAFNRPKQSGLKMLAQICFGLLTLGGNRLVRAVAVLSLGFCQGASRGQYCHAKGGDEETCCPEGFCEGAARGQLW